MDKCFGFKYGQCNILNATDCDGCSFFKTKEQIKQERQNAKKRIRQLEKDLQMYIAEKYHSK